MDIDLIVRQISELTNLIPDLVQRMDALERTVGAHQRQIGQMMNPEEAAEKSTPHKK